MALLDLIMLQKICSENEATDSSTALFEIPAVIELSKVLNLLEPEWAWYDAWAPASNPDYWPYIQRAFKNVVWSHYDTSPIVILDAVNSWYDAAMKMPDPRGRAIDALRDAITMVLNTKDEGDTDDLATLGVLCAVFGKEPSDLVG